jgi:Tfp pilus assembly protein PilX
MNLQRAVRALSSSERGIALVVALGFLVVLSILSVSVYSYTRQNAHSTRLSQSRLGAAATAEAGINSAFSVLSAPASDALQSSALPPAACGYSMTCVACGTSQCAKTTVLGGYALWSGSLVTTDGSGAVLSQPYWVITSTGYVGNADASKQVAKTARAMIPIAFIPPPYTFSSLNSACDQHTLVIKSSGQLTVTNAMYISSCNSPQDAFDIFGSGGSLSAPAINVVGGWETHNGDTVTVNGITCPLSHSSAPLTAAQPAGCPATGQPLVGDPFTALAAPSLGTPACTSTVYGSATSYSPKQNLVSNITATQTTIPTNGTKIQTGDIIQIDQEQMLVVAGGGTSTLTVQRAQRGTTAASHNSGPGGKEIKQIPVSAGGTAANPAPCNLQSGSYTLQPGTYYGGICIGAASGGTCGSVSGGTCNNTIASTAHVTMNPGVYIMAGGGFFVCGASTLSAPQVLIYDTQDPSNTSGSGAIDQVELATTGSVSLGPQTVPPYKGLTIFEDRNLGVASGVTCDSKTHYSTSPSQAQINEWDVALLSMGSTGANGALGSVSGTIYAPSAHANFVDAVSGRANLAVLTSCIFIDGGTSTFDFNPDGLFGLTAELLPVYLSG